MKGTRGKGPGKIYLAYGAGAKDNRVNTFFIALKHGAVTFFAVSGHGADAFFPLP